MKQETEKAAAGLVNQGEVRESKVFGEGFFAVESQHPQKIIANAEGR